jgi:stage II sporulation protein R
VLAESDSEDDQRRKLLVRDAVGAWMRQHAEGVESRAELEALIAEQSDEIRDVAERTLAEDGESQTVTVRLADVEFPEKEYGDYAFPAGTYRALQIIIGSGQGHNWWCVLYPNLCFSAEGYDVTAGGAKKELSRLLSPSEYESILKNHRYRLGFRFLK